MNKLKKFILNFIQRFNRKETNLSEKIFKVGDRVKGKFILEFDDIKIDFYHIGHIIDVNERYIKIQYIDKDIFINNCVYDYKDVISYSLEEEREEKLNKILCK